MILSFDFLTHDEKMSIIISNKKDIIKQSEQIIKKRILIDNDEITINNLKKIIQLLIYAINKPEPKKLPKPKKSKPILIPK